MEDLTLVLAMGDGIEVFSGKLDTPGGKLAIQVPEDDRSIAIDVGASTAEITIAVDDPANVAKVWVGVNVEPPTTDSRSTLGSSRK